MPRSASNPNQGIYRYGVGDMRLTALHDGIFRRPLEGLVRNATLEELQGALAECNLATDALTVTFTPLLIEYGERRVLIDTGHGEMGTDQNGFMLENLKKAGLKPDDITHVIISHFHGDHINGLRRKDGSEVFPQARILVPEAEWQYWMIDSTTMDLPENIANNRKVAERVFAPMVDRVEKYRDEQEILPGIIAFAAPGHTYGHSTFRLSSDGASLMLMSDVTNHPALFVRHPDWSPFFDMIPEQAVATRKHFLGLAADEGVQVAFFHAPFPATGYIERAQNGFRFIRVIQT